MNISLVRRCEPVGISQYWLANDIHVPLRRVNEIVLERRGISADTALRLARYFNTTPQFWLNLQSRYKLDTARLASEKTIEKTIQPAASLPRRQGWFSSSHSRTEMEISSSDLELSRIWRLANSMS